MARKFSWSAFLLIAVCFQLSSQQETKTHIEIRVTDATGAVIQMARVEITSPSTDFAAVGRTNQWGTANFDIGPGKYKLMVVSRGFFFKEMPIEVLRQPFQSVDARLQVGSCPGPGYPGGCVAVEPFPTTSQIGLSVTDTTGEPINSALVEIKSRATGQKVKLVTGVGGAVELPLTPGAYDAQVTARLFKRWAGEIEIGDSTEFAKIALNVDCAQVTCDPAIEPVEADIREEHQALSSSVSGPALEPTLIIRTAHNSAPELATKAQLERLIGAHDLSQWTFTHEILIDEKSIPHSHPVLTLHTRHLKQDDELLSTYLHEQLHWFLARHPAETKAAEQDLMKLYPNVPVGYPEGANDTESTYLHLLVCRLEQRADLAVLGEQRTAEVMQFWAGDHYRWVYRTVLHDGTKIDEILERHGLAAPDARRDYQNP